MGQITLGSWTPPSIPGHLCHGPMGLDLPVSILHLALPSCSVTLGEFKVKTLGGGNYVRLELRNTYHGVCAQWV